MFLIHILLRMAFSTPSFENKHPETLVDLRMIVPGIEIESRYHGTDNFTGAPLPGYGVNAAWLHHRAAAALLKVQSSLEKEGLALRIYDAYRPRRASLAMVAWAKRTNNTKLITDGYIARRSRHNLGIAVDLTIIHKSTGVPLDMGTAWDAFEIGSHTDNASGEPLKNRQKLRQIMEKHGFKAYSKEWWHFHYPIKSKAFDTPYGCFEPITWKEPDNWTDPSYNPPQKWNPTPCKTQ